MPLFTMQIERVSRRGSIEHRIHRYLACVAIFIVNIAVVTQFIVAHSTVSYDMSTSINRSKRCVIDEFREGRSEFEHRNSPASR